MNIAFIYIAEPYQCYHMASVASATAALPDCDVTEYYSFPETVEHLARIRRTLGAATLPLHPLSRSWTSRLLKKARRLDRERLMVLQENVEELNQYDVVVASENTAGVLKNMGLKKPKLIRLMHGAGDRYVNDEHLLKAFDLTLLPGPKTETYFRNQGLFQNGATEVIGYPKFDVFEAIRQKSAFSFPDGKPFALYNPHYQRALTSAPTCTLPLIRAFREQNDYNLVVAPHIKMFHKGFGFRARQFKRQQSANVLVDTGSSAMLDMTYTSQAAIYIGDISSQLYEFLAIPRPCIFLNPHKISWQDDPYYRNWTLGDIVDDPADIMTAVAQAQERHALYRPAQEKLFRETFGEPLLGASQRAAEAIVRFMSDA